MNKTIAALVALSMAAVIGLAGCAAPANASAAAPEKAQEQTASKAATEAASEEANAPESKEAKDIKLAYTVQDLANTYFVEVARGVQDRCDELGIEVIIHDGKTDAAGQISAFENFIVKKVDAIIVSPVDQTALVPSVEAAHAAGIPVVAGNQDVEGRDAFITVPEYEYGLTIGKNAGEWIATKLDGHAKVAIFDYPELESIIDRANGIADGILEKAPEAEIVARQSANNPEKGMAAMETILQANPDVEVLAAVNDAGALGAYEVMMAAGKASDRVYIGGLDATQEALAKIKEGGIYRATVDIQPYETGKLFVDTALKVIESGQIEETIEIPMKVVDSSNISEY